MHYLNEVFDKIYCINLNSRPDRWAAMSAQFEQMNLDVQRVEAFDGSDKDNEQELSMFYGAGAAMLPGEKGVIFTNLAIIVDAMLNRYKSILVLEDDVVFCEKSMGAIKMYFDYLPADWDMIWFSGNHNTHVHGTVPPRPINEYVCRVHNTFAAHAIGIKSTMFKKILYGLQRYDRGKQLDVFYADLQKQHECYCFTPDGENRPPLVTQAAGYSDIQGKEVDYGWLIK